LVATKISGLALQEMQEMQEFLEAKADEPLNG
jgi:hypothetical protein